jgi:LPS export ABC transporter protein LptC
MKTIFAPLIILLLLLIIFFSSQSPDITMPLSNEPKADFQFENVTISLLSNKKKVWTLTADESSIYNASDTFLFNNVHGTFFNVSNTFSFESSLGIFEHKKKMLNLIRTKSKLTINETPYFIICDEININTDKKIISAYGNILINSTHIIVHGSHLIANLNTQSMVLKNNVEGSFITN